MKIKINKYKNNKNNYLIYIFNYAIIKYKRSLLLHLFNNGLKHYS